uniref:BRASSINOSTEROID INSENSITIVE 1-associated receptor kinase 1 n=1 Tax=Cajanus cajan TaxID=3821 RepID=A0A151T4M6_CAJCA|nr:BRASSINOSTEROID INSENSITIVE 1-associated receptor kinase 1 [Cajanus cajan]
MVHRQMKKDEKFFQEQLSCGISILRCNNQIEQLRGPIDLPEEIQCSSHETYDGSLPSIPYKDLFGIDVFPNKEMIDQTKDDLLSQNQAQTISISNGVIFDGEQENSILENSMCTFCSVCKTGRPNIGQHKEFAYEELQAATDAFSLKNCLSKSGQLFTFKGQLEGGLKLVVKQHEIKNTQLREKMKSKVQTILKARHKNVIMLLGSSTSEHFLLTVYEYACNGSLDKYLSKEGCRPLTWIERERVAIGLARGLKYLHDKNIVHCNIKPTSILLTHDFRPLIGDFGFGKELELNSSKNKNKGNYEYIAPECLEKGKLSNKTDVYSFGVVILELITGRRTTDMMLEDKGLVEWVSDTALLSHTASKLSKYQSIEFNFLQAYN